MSNEELDRKRSDKDLVVIHQDAFASRLKSDELLHLGMAIKYAGLIGKEVRIIPAVRS